MNNISSFSHLINQERLESKKQICNMKNGNTYTSNYLRDRECFETSYVDDFTIKWLDMMPEDYRLIRKTYLDWFFRLGLRLGDFKDKIVLDGGCGVGSVSEMIVNLASQIVGVELSNSINLIAKNLANHKNFLPIQASIENLPLRDKSFDIVFSHGVVHHTSNPRKSMSELWRVVKPGGKLIVWVYPDNDFMRRRSLLTYFLSDESTDNKKGFSELLSKWLHFSAQDYDTGRSIIARDLCCSLKTDPINTSMYNIDSLCPTFHHVLQESFFRELGFEDIESSFYTNEFKVKGQQMDLTVTLNKKAN